MLFPKTASRKGDEFTISAAVKKIFSGKSDSGQAVTEYAIILGAVGLAGIVILSLLGGKVRGVFSSAVCEDSAPDAVYTVSYDPGEGINAPDSQTAPPGGSVTISEDVPVLDGWEFAGWASSADAEEPEYLPGDSLCPEGSIVLHALWRQLSVSRSSEASGSFSGGAFIEGPRRISAGASLRSDGATLTWDVSLSLTSTAYIGDTGSFSGMLSVGGTDIPVGESGVSKDIYTRQIPVSNLSGINEIPGLSAGAEDVPWTLTGRLRLYNSGSVYGTGESDQTIEISLSGMLQTD